MRAIAAMSASAAERTHAMRSVMGTRLTGSGLYSLAHDERDHHESGKRICPPPSGDRVQPQTHERDDGEVRAKLGLFGVGDQRMTVEPGGRGALGAAQPRHGRK